MSFRKFQAKTIFDGTRLLDPAQVLITRQDGTIVSIVREDDAGDDVQQHPGIIAPGFINCHCHLELSHMKGRIPEGTGLVDFVYKVVTERHHPEEEIIAAITAAEDEMLATGIVAVGDICNNATTIFQKQYRRLQYYNFIEASGWLPSVSSSRWERARQLYEQFRSLAPGVGLSIVPHAPYSVSAELWAALQPGFADKVISIHNQETRHEDEFFYQGTGDFARMYQLMNIDNSHHQPTGLSSLQSYFPKLSRAAKALLVHNSFTGAEDINYVKASGRTANTFFCLCINANLYIEKTVPPVELLTQHGCNITLGTDSLASNWSLSIADEMRSLRKHFPALSLEEMLRWATRNGAEALQLDDLLGSFQPGKIPGVVHFDENLSFMERLL